MKKSPYEEAQRELVKTSPKSEASTPTSKSPTRSNGLGWIITCLAIAVGSLLYRLMVYEGVEQTALMFIGLPTAMAILIGLTPSPGSITGKILKGTALALLLSGILLVEGLACILMASPLFFLVGLIIGGAADLVRYNNRKSRLRCIAIAALPLTLVSFEGTTDWLSFDRDEEIVITRTIDLKPDEAISTLARGPGKFDLEQLPNFFHLGFPAPQSITGEGIAVGDEWKIHFSGGEGKPGDLVVRVTESTPERMVFKCVSDTSHISHWMQWHQVIWEFRPTATDSSELTMTVNYERSLDPAWYFKPLERFAVRLACKYFIAETFDH